MRGWLGLAAAGAALTAALWAALIAGPDGHLAYGVESLSSAATALLEGPGIAVPRVYALVAGVVAAVNPCGFALLPGYLGLYLRGAGGDVRSIAGRSRRAVVFAVAVAASFVLLFGLAGLAVSLAGAAVTATFPWVGLLVGLSLLVAGGRLLAGAAMPGADLGARLADRLGPATDRGGLVGASAYGLAYALASLGCALPVFLTVIGSSLVVGSWAAGLLQFLLYAAGMALALAAVTVAAAVVETALLVRVRQAGRLVEPAGAVVLLLVGAYVIYYWLTVGGILA